MGRGHSGVAGVSLSGFVCVCCVLQNRSHVTFLLFCNFLSPLHSILRTQSAPTKAHAYPPVFNGCGSIASCGFIHDTQPRLWDGYAASHYLLS